MIRVTVGYAGGVAVNPSCEDICVGSTGHTEAAEVKFDPDVVTYRELLPLFWRVHDPTQLNRQGPDVGTQYLIGLSQSREPSQRR